MLRRNGFTLIELSVTTLIIALMLGLLIPNINRSLRRNDLANEAELIKAKIAETKIRSGSTQSDDEPATVSPDPNSPLDVVGYYAVYIPNGTAVNYFSVVRVSYPATEAPCPAGLAAAQAQQGLEPKTGNCIVEKITFAKGVSLSASKARLMAFRVPTQQSFAFECIGAVCNPETPPKEYKFSLKLRDKVASLTVQPYTVTITATYN